MEVVTKNYENLQNGNYVCWITQCNFAGVTSIDIMQEKLELVNNKKSH